MSADTQRDQDRDQPGLEVAPSDAPVVKSPEYPDLQVAPSDAPIVRNVDHSDLEVAAKEADVESSPETDYEINEPRRICGLRIVTFWLTLALVVMIIGVAVGGGVGGSLSNKAAKEASAVGVNTGPSTTPTETKTSSSATKNTTTTNTAFNHPTTANTATGGSSASTSITVIAASQSPPPGCSPNYDGTFYVSPVNVSSHGKRDLEHLLPRDGPLGISLKNGILTDPQGGTGYVGTNSQFQFADPPPPGIFYDAGFTVCQNSRLTLGSHQIWYKCKEGNVFNIYLPDGNFDPSTLCVQSYIDTIPFGSGHPVPVPSSSSAATQHFSSTSGAMA